MVEKPTGVVVVGALLAVNGLELILLALDFLISKPPYAGASLIFFKPTQFELNLIILALGLLSIFVAWGIWNGDWWGGIGGMIVATFNLPIKAVLSLAVLYLLLAHKKMKHYLRREEKIRKPAGVGIVVALLVTSGLQVILDNFMDFFDTITLIMRVPLSYYSGLVLILNLISPFGFGLLSILIAWGIWNLKKLARFGGIIIAALIFLLGPITSLLILYLLVLNKETKQAFSIPRLNKF